MKKNISIILISLFLFTSMLPISAFAFDDGTGAGLLQGVNMSAGSGVNVHNLYVSGVTDNDITTSYPLEFNGHTNDTLWYKFNSPVNINKQYLKVSGMVKMRFYDSSMQVIVNNLGNSVQTFSNVNEMYLIEYNNVSYVELNNPNTSSNSIVYEFDVYAGEPSPPDTTAPAEITGLTSTNNYNSATFTWTNPTDPDFKQVNVYRDTALIAQVTANSYTATGLTPETTYNYKFTTSDTSGNESAGITSTITTDPEPIDTTAPAEITGLASSINKDTGEVTFTWTNPTDPDYFNTKIYKDGSLIHETSNTTFTDIGTIGSTYNYLFTTTDQLGNESAGTSLVISIENDPPLAPTGLTVELSENKTAAVLNWTLNSELDFAGYNLYMSNGTAFNKINNTLLTNSTYTHSNLAEGVTYSYYLVAIDTGGNESLPSETVSITTPTITAKATIEKGDTSLLVTWNSVDNALSYDIYLNGSFIANVDALTTTYTITTAQGYNPDQLVQNVKIITNFTDGTTSAGNGSTGSWGFEPRDIFTNASKIVFSLAGFVLLGIAIMYVPALIGLIRKAVKPSSTN